jgi:hypothetical protein
LEDRILAIAPERPQNRWSTDPEYRERMREIARKVNEEAGIVGPPTMTLEELRKSMRDRGIRPEDNILSRELMRMRYGDDWEPTEEGE